MQSERKQAVNNNDHRPLSVTRCGQSGDQNSSCIDGSNSNEGSAATCDSSNRSGDHSKRVTLHGRQNDDKPVFGKVGYRDGGGSISSSNGSSSKSSGSGSGSSSGESSSSSSSVVVAVVAKVAIIAWLVAEKESASLLSLRRNVIMVAAVGQLQLRL